MAHIKRMTDKPRNLPYRAQVKRKGHLTLVKMFQTRAQAERWAREQEKSILETGLPLTIKHLEKYTISDIVRRYLKEITPKKGSRVSETAVLNAFLRTDTAKLSLAYVKRKDEPPPLKWSDLKYVIWHQGGPKCRGSDTSRKRL